MNISAIWILIIYTKLGYSGGPLAVEFSSKETCQAALVAVQEEMPPYQYGICVKK